MDPWLGKLAPTLLMDHEKGASALGAVPIWGPLRHRRYRALWFANLLTSLGNGAQTFAAAWLIASVSSSAAMTAAVQAVAFAPLLLFALIAGAVADAVHRPKFLFFVNLGMALCAGACAIAVFLLPQHRLPVPVLLLTFLFGVGTALRWPCWQASVSLLAPPHELEAVAILENLVSSAGAIAGPALGGVLFSWLGPAAPFVANLLSFIVVLCTCWNWWRADPVPSVAGSCSGTKFWHGIMAAASDCRYRCLLATAGIVYFLLIAFSALLPTYVKEVMHLGSSAYGILSASLGLGAALGAFLLPTLRARLNKETVFMAALAVHGAMLVSLTLCTKVAVLAIWILVGGMGWCALIALMVATAQASFAPAVRARALSLYLFVMAAGYTSGSYFWGKMADGVGVAGALRVAGGILLAGAAVAALASWWRGNRVLVSRR